MMRILWVLCFYGVAGTAFAQQQEQERTVEKNPEIKASFNEQLDKAKEELAKGNDINGGIAVRFPVGGRGKRNT